MFFAQKIFQHHNIFVFIKIRFFLLFFNIFLTISWNVSKFLWNVCNFLGIFFQSYNTFCNSFPILFATFLWHFKFLWQFYDTLLAFWWYLDQDSLIVLHFLIFSSTFLWHSNIFVTSSWHVNILWLLCDIFYIALLAFFWLNVKFFLVFQTFFDIFFDVFVTFFCNLKIFVTFSWHIFWHLCDTFLIFFLLFCHSCKMYKILYNNLPKLLFKILF